MRRRLLACLALLVALAVVAPRAAVAREYAAVFCFGDSLSDIGNLCVDGIPDYLATARSPYGMTYFGYPTGRVSNGRVVIDFIAQELGLPLLPPSKAKNATFRRGANFAITGATALGMDFFEEHGLARAVWSSGSLHTQIRWFRDMKPSICSSSQECRELFRRSLFVVGEFGGNDYWSTIFSFRPLEEVHALVLHVVGAVRTGDSPELGSHRRRRCPERSHQELERELVTEHARRHRFSTDLTAAGVARSAVTRSWNARACN